MAGALPLRIPGRLFNFRPDGNSRHLLRRTAAPVIASNRERNVGIMETINVGLFGLGVVGCGVVEILQRNRELIRQRLGAELRITKAVTAHPDKERPVPLEDIAVSADPETILGDPEIHIVAELIGGVGLAREVVLRALESGKPVVTANKALLAEHAGEVFGKAYERGVGLGIEASVAGGIPVLRALREGLAADRILEITGIVNGTCNYILTKMSQEGTPFDEVLAEAQRLGYAEADPAFDVGGLDAAQKLAVLIDIAYGTTVNYPDIHVEGIEGVTPMEGRMGNVRDSERTATVRPETLRPPARPVLTIELRPADEATAPAPSDRLSRERIGLPPAAMAGDVARLRLMLERTGDAGDAETIAHTRGDNTGHVSSVTGLVRGIGIAVQKIAGPGQARSIDEVPARYVVDVAIAVVVYPLRPPLLHFVHPHLIDDIRVREVEPRVDDGDQHGIAPGGNRLVPAHGKEVPLLGELGVVGDRGEA